MSDFEPSVGEPLFRASKRRKVLRRRLNDDNDAPSVNSQNQSRPLTTSSSTATSSHSPLETAALIELEEHILPMAQILRRRKLAKARRAGIEFSNSSQNTHSNSTPQQPSDALVSMDDGRSAVEAAVNRFAPQTGKVADVLDKHMIEYIDSKMTELRQTQSSFITPGSSATQFAEARSASASVASDAHRERQPAGLGKLQEIDLGPDATAQNIARTEAATRRLGNGTAAMDEEEAAREGKVRLGKDGKPWKGRKRRNSEDVKRDMLVEEVLRESRLEIYDEPEASGDADGDQAADDIIAEQFRREFMDAITSRNIRRTAPAPPGAVKGVKSEDRPKGPKLGGSRSARAAMRALEEKAAKKR